MADVLAAAGAGADCVETGASALVSSASILPLPPTESIAAVTPIRPAAVTVPAAKRLGSISEKLFLY